MKREYIFVGAGVVAVAVLILVLRPGGTTPPPNVPLPDSMAAIGDSITQAVAVNEEALSGAAEHSWATGSDGSDSILSHYERLVAAHPSIAGNVSNNSVPGARMADALAQATVTVGQHPDYVVFMMGANDVCAADAASMTSTTDFESQFEAALNELTSGLPDASIYVVSIPNVYRLWEVEHENLVASTIWTNAGICQSVLSANDADRDEARDRNEEFNEILERVCSQHPTCLYDGGAVYDYAFSADEIGPVDHFHPSEQGQEALAQVSWENGYWPDL